MLDKQQKGFIVKLHQENVEITANLKVRRKTLRMIVVLIVGTILVLASVQNEQLRMILLEALLGLLQILLSEKTGES